MKIDHDRWVFFKLGVNEFSGYIMDESDDENSFSKKMVQMIKVKSRPLSSIFFSHAHLIPG